MKALAEIALIGFIGTFTIMLGIIVPPSIIKTTIHEQADFTYNFEKVQHALLSLFSSTIDGQDTYELIGINFLIERKDSNVLEEKLDELLDTDYCLSMIKQTTPTTGYVIAPPITPGPVVQFLGTKCFATDVNFNTIFVQPYNKEALVKIMRIGIE